MTRFNQDDATLFGSLIESGTDDDIVRAKEMLDVNQITELHFSDIIPNLAFNIPYLNIKNISGLAKVLTGNKTLEVVNFSGKEITDQEAEELALVLKGTKLKTLYLSGAKITDEGVQALAKGLNTELETLDLSGTQIADKGLASLAAVLKDTKLKTLNLSFTRIADEGVASLAAVLKDAELKTLHLSFAQITDKGADALIEGLKVNKTLRTLYLAGNQSISPAKQVELAALSLINGIEIMVPDGDLNQAVLEIRQVVEKYYFVTQKADALAQVRVEDNKDSKRPIPKEIISPAVTLGYSGSTTNSFLGEFSALSTKNPICKQIIESIQSQTRTSKGEVPPTSTHPSVLSALMEGHQKSLGLK